MKIILLVFFLQETVFAQVNLFKNIQNPICFGREFSSEHLKKHPQQSVQRIRVKIHKESHVSSHFLTLSIDTNLLLDRVAKKEFISSEYPSSHFQFHADMLCEYSDSELKCFIECDGGSATIKDISTQNEKMISLHNNGFALLGRCDDESEDFLWLDNVVGGDDIFNLYALPSEYCSQ